MTLTKKDLTDALKATKNDILDAMRENSQQVTARFDGVDRRFDGVNKKIDRRINEVKVLIEDVRHDLRFTFEVREPHEKKLQKHDKMLQDHHERIETLEDVANIKRK